MSTISKDNKIIHGMWFGTHLSRLELLTLHSFVHFGHEFQLWAYDDLSHYDFPRGVTLRDAAEIIPRKGVFAKSARDRETGVGRNSFGAPFSDLFRYKLLNKYGGIWVDMDVTCLRPFNFPGKYAFRPHRIGVVGSILKCPAGAPIIKKIYYETARSVNPDSDYLLPNRILTKHVAAMGLQRHIVKDISNDDNWMAFIRPLIENLVSIPEEWYAIHWINEMWRTLKDDCGDYRGRRLLDYVPDKDAPHPGSTLWELYRKYGLIDARDGPNTSSGQRMTLSQTPPPLPIRTPCDQSPTLSYLNVLLPSLVRGGAERSVLETIGALKRVSGLRQMLFVVHRSRRQYRPDSGENLKVTFADNPSDIKGAMRAFALEMLQASAPVVYTHLIPADQLRHLWDMGISTIPVVQNMRPGWNDPPSAYNSAHVPFVVGVSDAVSSELHALGCPKPVVTLRHELQRAYTPADLARQRREIRDRYGIADNTLLIGMVGQFKSQKAYTRAVRVLHRVRAFLPAKLMIIGGWDHDYGEGRAAYEATCRRAVDLGVIADMIMPGDMDPSDPYLAAFDVFLNTSIYEGLSVALLEAIQSGCPIVTADAGGNREVLPPDAVLVADGADIEAYVSGILRQAEKRERVLPQRPSDPALVPRLWALIAKHGIANSISRPSAASGSLFLTENLQIGGPQTSLINLLPGLSSASKIAVCVLHGAPLASHKQKLDAARIPILSADSLTSIVDKAEFVLNWIDALHIRNLVFWNAGPEFKTLLAKILLVRDVRLYDVSPGLMLFDELDAAASFERRIALTARQYFARLNGFVTKYKGGAPPASLCPDRTKIHLIPNGVPRPPTFVPLPPPASMLSSRCDNAFAIGTCCRIVPDKRIEFLLKMMATLSTRVPGTSLTVVGAPDDQSSDYFNGLQQRVENEGIRNVFFVGGHEDVTPFLGQFKVFVMVSERQGCPNASLEAMAIGLPVVANRSGGVAEQVEDGVNGFLVSTPAKMAERVAELLKSKKLCAKMGRAGRAVVAKRFSVETMIASYSRLFKEDR
jgi:glycosyltransferase involved in cell wall biosynthesis